MYQPDETIETIHDWVFAVVYESCFDREYLYRAFVEHFGRLLQAVYRSGSSGGSGDYLVSGLKGGPDVCVTWELSGPVSFIGPNAVDLCAAFPENAETIGAPPLRMRFDLSTGARVSHTPLG